MPPTRQPQRGRGSSDNPQNRFKGRYLDYELDAETGRKPKRQTRLYPDDSKQIISTNNSPDISFDASLNPYRGCEHGCIYCYARPTHEYLDFSAGLDFESRIMVKYDAPKKLRQAMSKPSWTPQTVVMSGVTDCYQPTERRLELTRGCLQVFAEFRNPVSIITKNYLVCRDSDLLAQLAAHKAARVTISITTLDRDLARVMEPRTSQPGRRLQAIKKLARAGIPVGVNVAPIIPGLTDHECARILQAAKSAGACYAGYTIVRLPHGVKNLFNDWLEHHYPNRKEKVLNKIRNMRNGKLNEAEFGTRFKGRGHYADQIRDLFRLHKRRLGYHQHSPRLSTDAFKPAAGYQTSLF